MARIVLISKEQSSTKCYFVQDGMRLGVLSSCCDEGVKGTASDEWICGSCRKTVCEYAGGFAKEVDLKLYIGMFGPDKKATQKNWAPFLEGWFGLSEGSVELKW